MSKKGIIFLFLGLILVGGGTFSGVYFMNVKGEEGMKAIMALKKTKEEATETTEDDELAMDFLKIESGRKNLVYSPLSIRYGLSLLKEGANGETKTEIEKVLGEKTPTKYENVKDKLSLANAVFIREGFKDAVLASYVKAVEKNYNAEVIYDPFKDAALLDKWVSEKTFKLIDKIGVEIEEDTEMVLANALAIQMNFVNGFNGNTFGGKFYTLTEGGSAGGTEETITATTMNYDETKSENVGFYQGEEETIATIDLEKLENGTQLEFIAVMPEDDTLERYIEKVGTGDILAKEKKKTLASETKKGVNLYMPKFDFETDLDFKGDLGKLGVKSAFDKKLADFSEMAKTELYVSDAIHKAKIEFSEKGIKAAAVTTFSMSLGAALDMDEEKPITIRIDKPFLFMIVDKGTGEVWFIGKVYRPNLWENDKAAYESDFEL